MAGDFRIKDNSLVVQIGLVAGFDSVDSSYVSVFETVLTLGANDLLGNNCGNGIALRSGHCPAGRTS